MFALQILNYLNHPALVEIFLLMVEAIRQLEIYNALQEQKIKIILVFEVSLTYL